MSGPNHASTSSIPFYVFNDTAATVRADRSRDTTGYNPRSNIIEGGSWTRVRPHFAQRLNIALAARINSARPDTVTTPIALHPLLVEVISARVTTTLFTEPE